MITESRTMAELEQVALEALRKRNPTPVRCGVLGDELFRGLCNGHNGSAPFARITGKIMKRLEAKELAYSTKRNGFYGWVISQRGLASAATTEPEPKET